MQVWRVCTAVLAFGAASAHADDEPAAPEVSEGPEAVPAESRWFELDPVFRPQLQGLGTVEERQQVTLRLSPSTIAVIDGAWWQNEDGKLPAIDVPGLGWRAGLQLSHDFGFARLDVGGALSDIETPVGRGRYVDLGLALRKTWKLSRWTKLWLSLGFGMRSWLGQPPAGEADAGAFMLRLGGTFR